MRISPAFGAASLVLVATLASACSSSDSVDPAGAGGSPGDAAADAVVDDALDAGADGADAEAGPPRPGNAHNVELGPDLRCPGDPSCAASADTTFYAAAAVVDISPVVDHVVKFAPGHAPWNFDPAGGDECVDAVTGQTAGIHDCVWMATGPRAAKDVADPTSVRCTVMKRGETKVGLCAIDCIGWFYNEIERTRALIASENPELDLDMLVVAATHNHQTEDTLGYFGPDEGTSGLDPAYNERIRKATRDALVSANGALEPVKIQFGAIKVNGQLAGTDPAGIQTAGFVSDTRDPVVIDDELRTMRFIGQTGKTVATIVNWTSHAEFSGSDNLHITADYPGGLRDAIEKGIDDVDPSGAPVHYDGVGGTAIFFTGALGGQVGPGEVTVYGLDGKVHDYDHATREGGPEKARTSGKMVAIYALESLKNGSQTLETVPLGFRARELYLEVENRGYHIALVSQLFDRPYYFVDMDLPLGPGNLPVLKTQEVVLDVGPAEMITIPGEMHAELLLATKDGKTSVEAPYPFTPPPYFVLNDPTHNPNCGQDGHSRCDDGPPAIEQMDKTKVVDLYRDPKATYRWVIGLGQDETGYVVPAYDFKLDPVSPYLNEASPGDHYEETNSVGSTVEPEMLEPLRDLLRTAPVVTR